MRIYTANGYNWCYMFHVRSDVVVWASSGAQWAVGRKLSFVRSFFKQKGAAFYEVKRGT